MAAAPAAGRADIRMARGSDPAALAKVIGAGHLSPPLIPALAQISSWNAGRAVVNFPVVALMRFVADGLTHGL